jgi:hypothetical protein
VLKPATPELFKAPAPRLALPSQKATVPVGVPPLPLAVALKVTVLPAAAGFAEELSTTVVGVGVVLALVMIWASTREVLPAKTLSPP